MLRNVDKMWVLEGGKGESGLGRCGKEWKKAGGLWIGAKNVYGL